MSIKYNAIQTFLLVLSLIFASNCFAGAPRCFLHGTITPSGDNKEKMSLENMIRMHFDADDKTKCERMLKAYCLYNVTGKQYSADKLLASFKQDVAKDDETIYHFGPACKLISSDNEYN